MYIRLSIEKGRQLAAALRFLIVSGVVAAKQVQPEADKDIGNDDELIPHLYDEVQRQFGGNVTNNDELLDIVAGMLLRPDAQNAISPLQLKFLREAILSEKDLAELRSAQKTYIQCVGCHRTIPDSGSVTVKCGNDHTVLFCGSCYPPAFRVCAVCREWRTKQTCPTCTKTGGIGHERKRLREEPVEGPRGDPRVGEGIDHLIVNRAANDRFWREPDGR